MAGKVKVGVIGVGARGTSLLNKVMLEMDDVEVVAVSDFDGEKVKKSLASIKEIAGNEAIGFSDYKKLLAMDEIEAVVINTGWSSHISLAVDAMEAGKYVGVEVGGAYSIDDCWRLVRTSERTGMPCMMLENCCYSRTEMMVLNVVKQGLFGEIVHCSGGYSHDLRHLDLIGRESTHYRLKDYVARNCHNYPTHDFGPIAKILKINRGNRMLTLSSTASKSAGLHEYIVKTFGSEHKMANVDFAQGDIVTTVIKCAGGETVSLTLDTTLPRGYYSRGLCVRGTKGMYYQDSDSFFTDDMDHKNAVRGNGKDLMEKYDHPVWKEFNESGVKGGHGGADWLVLSAFFESVKNRTSPPIDVYDSAAWMSITTLSEQSIAMGSMPVYVPDFTNGKWVEREPASKGKYCIDEI